MNSYSHNFRSTVFPLMVFLKILRLFPYLESLELDVDNLLFRVNQIDHKYHRTYVVQPYVFLMLFFNQNNMVKLIMITLI